MSSIADGPTRIPMEDNTAMEPLAQIQEESKEVFNPEMR